jgi:hypothetical protein
MLHQVSAINRTSSAERGGRSARGRGRGRGGGGGGRRAGHAPGNFEQLHQRLWHLPQLVCDVSERVQERGTLARRHAPVLYHTLNAAWTQPYITPLMLP